MQCCSPFSAARLRWASTLGFAVVALVAAWSGRLQAADALDGVRISEVRETEALLGRLRLVLVAWFDDALAHKRFELRAIRMVLGSLIDLFLGNKILVEENLEDFVVFGHKIGRQDWLLL